MAERIVFEGELDLEHLNLIKALSAREMYIEELAQIAERDERIVITGADVGAGGKIGEFKEKYPDRFIDTGIAEADQVGVSAGIALNGKIVYLQRLRPVPRAARARSGAYRRSLSEHPHPHRQHPFRPDLRRRPDAL